MPLHPETCAHCSSAMALLHQSYEAKTPPPEAIRSAILFGVAVAEDAGTAPTCEECRAQIETNRAIVNGDATPAAP